MPSGRLKEKWLDEPTCGVESRLKTSRSSEYTSVAVPTVERALAARGSWSMTIAAVRFSRESTSGRR